MIRTRIDLFIEYGGGVGRGKPIMEMIGLDMGPVRTPEYQGYEKALKALGVLG